MEAKGALDAFPVIPSTARGRPTTASEDRGHGGDRGVGCTCEGGVVVRRPCEFSCQELVVAGHRRGRVCRKTR